MAFMSYADRLLSWTLNYTGWSQMTFIKLWFFAALAWALVEIIRAIIALKNVRLLLAWGIVAAIVMFEFFDIMIAETQYVLHFFIFGFVWLGIRFMMKLYLSVKVRRLVEERLAGGSPVPA